VRPRTHAEKKVGLWQLKIVEKEVRHIGVIMLTGMHQDVVDLLRLGLDVVFFDRFADRRDFHKIRSRADDRQDFIGHHPPRP
jgi:hypothetical protein